MGCKFPEHHGSVVGSTSDGGGVPWPLIIAVGAVALLAPLVGVIIHVIALVLTFTGIATLAAGGGWVWWRVTHRRQRQIPSAWQSWPRVPPGRYVPQMQSQRQQQAVQAPQVHLNFHTAEAVEAFRRAVEGR